MPNMDRTGPQELGPLTGKGFGRCGNGLGHGCRRGFGCGFGFRNNIPLTITKDEERKILESEIKEIELEKQEIEKRLKESK